MGTSLGITRRKLQQEAGNRCRVGILHAGGRTTQAAGAAGQELARLLNWPFTVAKLREA